MGTSTQIPHTEKSAESSSSSRLPIFQTPLPSITSQDARSEKEPRKLSTSSPMMPTAHSSEVLRSSKRTSNALMELVHNSEPLRSASKAQESPTRVSTTPLDKPRHQLPPLPCKLKLTS